MFKRDYVYIRNSLNSIRSSVVIHIVCKRTETNEESDKCKRKHNRNAAVDKLIGEDLYGSDRVRHSGREIYRAEFGNKWSADVSIFEKNL